jgi:hypothetical protein
MLFLFRENLDNCFQVFSANFYVDDREISLLLMSNKLVLEVFNYVLIPIVHVIFFTVMDWEREADDI